MRKGAIIILLAALGFVGWVFFSLTHVEPVKVVESKLSRSGDSVSVSGKVENTGNEAGSIQLEVRYFDDSGRSIASDTMDLGVLQPGNGTQFHSPSRVLDHVANYSIYLNHGRNPYGN